MRAIFALSAVAIAIVLLLAIIFGMGEIERSFSLWPNAGCSSSRATAQNACYASNFASGALALTKAQLRPGRSAFTGPTPFQCSHFTRCQRPARAADLARTIAAREPDRHAVALRSSMPILEPKEVVRLLRIAVEPRLS